MATVVLTIGQLKNAITESGLKPAPDTRVFEDGGTDKNGKPIRTPVGHYWPYNGVREDYIDGTRYSDQQGIQIDLDKLDRRITVLIAKDKSVAPRSRIVIRKFLGIFEEVQLDKLLVNPSEFAEALLTLPEIEGFNAEVNFLGHWYPLAMSFDTFDTMMGPINFCNGELVIDSGFSDYRYFSVGTSTFTEDGVPCPKTLRQIFTENNLRTITKETIADYHKRLERAAAFRTHKGTQVLFTGPSVGVSIFGSPRMVLTGSPEAPTKGVVESELENSTREKTRYTIQQEATVAQMPFVRVFSLQLKRYVWTDVDDLKMYDYDQTAIDRLTLPDNINSVIRKVFESSNNVLGGDVLSNRHGGMIILANGGPGVGKTLTAEVFAEFTKRPLYVMEIGEIGTDINELEDNLTKIFERVQKWNAVLLFDEADIFLHKRGDNLQHNAVVGIFLRLMDYYRGLLFMTTNRGDAIDLAFQSRITLRLEYPNLDLHARKSVWTTMFKQNKLEVEDTLPTLLAEKYSTINGRQIRNAVRLMKVLYPNGNFTIAQASEAIDFTPGLA